MDPEHHRAGGLEGCYRWALLDTTANNDHENNDNDNNNVYSWDGPKVP